MIRVDSRGCGGVEEVRKASRSHAVQVSKSSGQALEHFKHGGG